MTLTFLFTPGELSFWDMIFIPFTGLFKIELLYDQELPVDVDLFRCFDSGFGLLVGREGEVAELGGDAIDAHVAEFRKHACYVLRLRVRWITYQHEKGT